MRLGSRHDGHVEPEHHFFHLKDAKNSPLKCFKHHQIALSANFVRFIIILQAVHLSSTVHLRYNFPSAAFKFLQSFFH